MSEGEFPDTVSPGVRTGVLAAAMLEQACRDHDAARDERLGLYLESAGVLARSLGQELKALDGDSVNISRENLPAQALLVSAALRAADLATLAACAAPEFPRKSPACLRAVAVTRLATAAAQSLALERRALGEPEDYEERDLRGVEWRAGLAARQVDELLREDS